MEAWRKVETEVWKQEEKDKNKNIFLGETKGSVILNQAIMN